MNSPPSLHCPTPLPSNGGAGGVEGDCCVVLLQRLDSAGWKPWSLGASASPECPIYEPGWLYNRSDGQLTHQLGCQAGRAGLWEREQNNTTHLGIHREREGWSWTHLSAAHLITHVLIILWAVLSQLVSHAIGWLIHTLLAWGWRGERGNGNGTPTPGSISGTMLCYLLSKAWWPFHKKVPHAIK